MTLGGAGRVAVLGCIVLFARLVASCGGLNSGVFSQFVYGRVSNTAGTCVYAAGVSNSSCIDQREFDREELRLKTAIAEHRSAEPFIYFGTCSAGGPAAHASRYIMHKIRMEKIVATHPRYLILRLPQLAGKTQNPHTLLNFIFNRISRSEQFQVWRKARRNIIDVDDVARIGASLATEEHALGGCIDVASPADTAMPDIVELMAKLVEKKAFCDYLDLGDEYPIDVQRIRNVAMRCGVDFGQDYLERVLRKYYGVNAAR